MNEAGTQAPSRPPSADPDLRGGAPAEESAAPPATPTTTPGTESSQADLDKSREAIQDMFAGVAPRYDLLNRVLSGALDVVWRRAAARQIAPRRGELLLDLCCGTGDQSLALAKRGGQVVGADFCVPMLALAQDKMAPHRPPAHLAAADALHLPFARGRFDAASVSFGVRNVADLDRALEQILDVLKPGGRVAILEFALPEGWFRRPYLFYFRHVLPRIGRLLSPRASAYSYLPDSVTEFPQREGFVARMERAGFHEAAWRGLTFGTVCLYTGRRPQ